MTFRRLVILLALLAAIPLLWSWWGSDRRQIERRVAELQDLVSKSGTESALEGAATAKAITDLFAPSFEVRAEQLGFRTNSRQDLLRFVMQYRSTSEAIQMRISASSLSVAPEHSRATQNAAFEFPTGGPLGAANEVYRVQVNWLEGDAGWQIDYLDLIEIVDAPARRF